MEKEVKMSIEEAWKIVGNQSSWALKNMIRALSMMSALNTADDDLRLKAAKIAVKHLNPRYKTGA